MKKSLLLLFVCFAFTAVLAQKDTTLSLSEVTLADTSILFEKVEYEAEFVGGVPAWRQYLMQNIQMDGIVKAVPKKAKQWQQTAIVQFIVCTDGTLCDIKVINNVHPQVAKEAKRIVTTSPNWQPAMQNGRKVKAYRKQPITFMVTAE